MGTKSKKGPKKKIGRPPLHGGYSIINRDQAIKDHPEIRRYLEGAREALVRDVGGTEAGLSAQQTIMIDRIVSRLAVCRLIEVYVERLGIFRRDRLEGGKVLELEPALGVNYLAFSNSIDRALQALGLDKKQAADVLDLGKYIEQKDQEEAKARAKGGAKAGTKAQDGQAQRQGEDADAHGQGTGPGEIDDRRATSGDVSKPDGGEGQDPGEDRGKDEGGGDDGDEPGGSSEGI